MIDSPLRRAIIRDDLIVAVQNGLLSQTEMAQTLWLLNSTRDWKVQFLFGAPSCLIARVLQVCPLLNECAPQTAPTEEPRSAEILRALPPPTYGFSPAE
jgi:hypothetical protein